MEAHMVTLEQVVLNKEQEKVDERKKLHKDHKKAWRE